MECYVNELDFVGNGSFQRFEDEVGFLALTKFSS